MDTGKLGILTRSTLRLGASSAFIALLLLRPTLAHSAQTFGAWQVALSADLTNIYAATKNDSGAVLGEYCFPRKGSCVWALGIPTSCDDGHVYPLLANSDIGSAQIRIQCQGPVDGKLYSYAFTNFKSIDHLVKRASRVGFAMPLQADRFRVVRFVLNGASAALKTMRIAATKLMDSKPHRKHKTDTKDEII